MGHFEWISLLEKVRKRNKLFSENFTRTNLCFKEVPLVYVIF